MIDQSLEANQSRQQKILVVNMLSHKVPTSMFQQG